MKLTWLRWIRGVGRTASSSSSISLLSPSSGNSSCDGNGYPELGTLAVSSVGKVGSEVVGSAVGGHGHIMVLILGWHEVIGHRHQVSCVNIVSWRPHTFPPLTCPLNTAVETTAFDAAFSFLLWQCASSSCLHCSCIWHSSSASDEPKSTGILISAMEVVSGIINIPQSVMSTGVLLSLGPTTGLHCFGCFLFELYVWCN